MQTRRQLARNIRAANAKAYAASVADLDLTGISARSRAMILAGVRGGADPVKTTDELLVELDAVAELDDDGVLALTEELRARGLELAEDPDVDFDVLDKVIAAVESLETVTTERVAAATARSERAAEAVRKLKGETDEGAGGDEGEESESETEGEGETEGEETETETTEGTEESESEGEGDTETEVETGEAEKIAAAARTRLTNINARRPNSMRPRERAKPTHKALKLTAAASLPGIEAGSHLDTPEKIAAAFGEAIAQSRGYRGGREQIRVASLGVWDASEVYGEERTLRRDAEANDRKMEAVAGPRAIKAAGGICAAPPLDYTQPVLGVDDRPVWNQMLARFGADRGGVRTLPVPTLADVESGIDAWTEANDVDPSDPATKPCVTLTCPDETETLVDALTKCIKVGNYRQRYWPEQVDAWIKKAAIQAARFAESRHLTAMGAGSTQVAVDQVLGTTRDTLAALDRAGASMRNFFRLDPDFPLTFGFPAWLLDNMITDLARELPGATAERLATSDAMLADFMKARQINPVPFLDGESGQVFGAQTDGLLKKWPAAAITYLYPAGVWKGLDGGSLDFGVVRDSTLNATNDLMIFSETFEAVHFHGDGASYRMAIEICANGQTSNGVDLDVCTTGS